MKVIGTILIPDAKPPAAVEPAIRLVMAWSRDVFAEAAAKEEERQRIACLEAQRQASTQPKKTWFDDIAEEIGRPPPRSDW